MHLAPLIHDLAIILTAAAAVTLIFQRIRQPVVLGYIVAGLAVGPHGIAQFLPGNSTRLVTDLPNIRVWADLGVIFLMFSLGLEFSFRKLIKVGLSSTLTAGMEVSFMLGLGYACGRYLLKWSHMDSLFLAGMLAISSTTIIIKALDELKLKSRRFAEMIFGVLIVEDLFAVLILVGLSTLTASASFSSLDLMTAAGKLVLTIGAWFLTGYFLVPRFVRYVGKLGNDEMLTIVSLGLCLLLVAVAATLHYSSALGAFIMGSILAESTESYRIEELIAPLRDVFVAVFFVSVGMLIDPRVLVENASAILIVTCVLALGKIVGVTMGSLVTGQTVRTSVQVGFGMAQIGEFSFLIAGLGQALQVTRPSLYPVGVAVSVLTTFLTPYLIRVSHKFAVKLESVLPHRMKNAFTQYAAWAQERRANNARRRDFYQRALRFLLNAILVVVGFFIVGEILRDRLALTPAVGWAVALLLVSPFVWAMFFAFRDFKLGEIDAAVGPDGPALSASLINEGPRGGIASFISRLLTLVLVGALSLEFLDFKRALLFTAVAEGVLFLIFARRLAASYRWFETRFLSTFKSHAKTRKTTDVFQHLAPWDAHLVRFKVHPNSELAGKKLKDLDLRGKMGLNIVVIQRGVKTIVAPQPHEQIFPKDELLVLGNDEQVELARPQIEKPPGLRDRFRGLGSYELRPIFVEKGSALDGVTIRQAGIRENKGGMVVGIERGDRRIINPSSDHRIEAGDSIWVVGEAEKIGEL